MRWLVVALTAFWALMMVQQASASVIELNELSVDYLKFGSWSRDPLFVGDTLANELDFNIKTSVLKYGFVDAQVHSMTDQSQFHVAGLRYRMGIRIWDLIDIFMGHQSTHVLDNNLSGYPEQDYGGVTLYLYRRGK